MCGRYALTVEPAVLSALLALRDVAEFEPRWNLDMVRSTWMMP